MASHGGQTPGMGDTGSYEIAETRTPEGAGEWLAQVVSTITVPAPEANKVVTVRVEAGRTLQLKFNNTDVVKREVINDDLVLHFGNGGRVVLQDYMEAFGLMADITTSVVQADGKSFLLPDLLDAPTATDKSAGKDGTGTGQTGPTAIVVEMPGDGEQKVVNLRFGRSVRFKFDYDDVVAAKVDDDGNLTLTLGNGGSIKLVNWEAIAAKVTLKAVFDDQSLALIELVHTGGGGDPVNDGTNNFAQVAFGSLGPDIDQLGSLDDETLEIAAGEPVPSISLPLVFVAPGAGPAGPPPSPPALSVDDVVVNEAAGVVTFTITRTGDLSGTSSVTVTTADGTAFAGSDYGATGPVIVDFAVGQVTATFTVPILDDSVFEDPESFFVNLTSPTDATIADDQGVATIIDDDPRDDTPAARNDKFTVDGSELVTTDAAIIFDHSGSMGQDPGVPGFPTRVELARDAVAQLVGSPGIQNVMVVGFDNNATSSLWGTPAEALAVIDSFVAGGTTNYAAAIQQLIDNFDTAANPRPPAADVTNVYFLSDGVPVPASADLSSNGLVGAWETFLIANNVNAAYAVGIGSGVSGGDADLEEIAFPNGDPDNPVILLDESELAGTLVGTLANSVTGNVLSDNGDGADSFGGNGPGQIDSITVDDITYVYDASANTITPTSGPVIAGGALIVTTALGGQLTFAFADEPGASQGDFAYTAPVAGGNADEAFSYAIVDADGDRSEADFDICITTGGPCAPSEVVATQAILLPDAQSPGSDAFGAYVVFGTNGPQFASLADIGVTSGDSGDLVLRIAINAANETHAFAVFRPGGDGVIDLGAMGDMGGDGAVDAASELNLSFADVMDLSEVTGGLVIHGREGDAVSADLRGHEVAAEDHGGFNRYIIDGGSAHLDIDKLVQQTIITDFG